MSHSLWLSRNWATASEQEVIEALLSPPANPNPMDFNQIQLHHPEAKEKYLNLFYKGNIPASVKDLHGIQ
jgi:hypothetical protein